MPPQRRHSWQRVESSLHRTPNRWYIVSERVSSPGFGREVRNGQRMSCSYEPGAATGNNAEIDKLALETDFSQLSHFLVTKKREDIGAFKRPFLRDALLTAPYMHDGSIETLWDVIEFFNKGGERNHFSTPS